MVDVDIHGIGFVAISIRVYIIFKICLVLAELFVAHRLFSSCAVRASRRGVLWWSTRSRACRVQPLQLPDSTQHGAQLPWAPLGSVLLAGLPHLCLDFGRKLCVMSVFNKHLLA